MTEALIKRIDETINANYAPDDSGGLYPKDESKDRTLRSLKLCIETMEKNRLVKIDGHLFESQTIAETLKTIANDWELG